MSDKKKQYDQKVAKQMVISSQSSPGDRRHAGVNRYIKSGHFECKQ
jgi:hypothetical protein